MLGLLISILWALVYVALVAIAIWIILWAITSIAGIEIPARVVQLIWVVVLLICIIIVLSVLSGAVPSGPYPWHVPR